jgi:hypothetical protein
VAFGFLGVKEASHHMINETGAKMTPFSGENRGTTKQLPVASSITLSIPKLSKLKHLALRRNVWYRCLNRLERGIIDLTVQCVDSIKSSKLANVVTAIVSKLDTAMEGMVDRLVRSVGLPLAQKISAVAEKLGNISAKSWATDRSFARYLAVTSLNS